RHHGRSSSNDLCGHFLHHRRRGHPGRVRRQLLRPRALLLPRQAPPPFALAGLGPARPAQRPARNRTIAAASAAAIARWTLGVTSNAASAALFMLPVSIRTFGIVVRFRPARSLRLM